MIHAVMSALAAEFASACSNVGDVAYGIGQRTTISCIHGQRPPWQVCSHNSPLLCETEYQSQRAETSPVCQGHQQG
ncbi:hypothetical protein F5883DRAFT_254686 [Diaporthe sp. PMI_573]|nr:hypothetical protein F5883DRAFT_254686 [Diaporthaceae sp. PMI_573]